MPVTPTWGWNIPTVNGDLGVWGAILNAAVTEIDADLATVNTATQAAQTAAGAAQGTATSALNLATTVQAALATKILVYNRAPTGSDTAPDGTLWCQV